MIEKYNEIISKIVNEFAKRYYKELFNEKKYKDYRLMDYEGINQGPLEINDEYYSIDDILITIKFEIPMNIVRERYNASLEANNKNKTLGINLFNFYQRHKNQEGYYEKEYNEIIKSEKKREEARKQLLELLNNITKCSGENCNKKETCKRFLCKKSAYQSYGEFWKMKECTFYLNNQKENDKRTIRKDVGGKF